MTHVLKSAALPLVIVSFLAGCSGDDPGDATPSTTAATTDTGASTPSTSSPPTSVPGETGSQPEGEGIPLEAFADQVERNDARADAEAVNRCASRDPADPACADEVAGLSLSAAALAFQLDALGAPTPEVAELVAETISTARAAEEAASAYLAGCPEAGATSEQCQTDLVVLAEGPGEALVQTVKAWRQRSP